jgi:phosphohistidine phosphatase
MVRALYLLRHAKSSWDDPSVGDHDRPLAPRGRQAAARIARHVHADGIRPALVLCSSARRAVETLEPIAAAYEGGLDVRIEGALYGADAPELLARVRRVPPEVASVLVVGHNPGMQDLVLRLAGDGDAGAMAQAREKFPTGALATLDVGDDRWDGLAPGRAFLARLVVPRALD